MAKTDYKKRISIDARYFRTACYCFAGLKKLSCHLFLKMEEKRLEAAVRFFMYRMMKIVF